MKIETKLTAGIALATTALVVLTAACKAIDLLEHYPTTLTAGDAVPEHARPWEFNNADVFRLSRFNLEVGKGLRIEMGPADVGIAHCADGAVWAVLIPREGGKLTSSATDQTETIAHVWLRFHPNEISHVFPAETVLTNGATDAMPQMRDIAAAKFRSSWHAGMNAMIPEPKDMTVDVDTKAGLRRFFMVDTAAQKAEYVAAFEQQSLQLSQSPGETRISLDSAPPVVVKTVPVAGSTDVDPALTEIRVTYSKAMRDGSWSWSTWGEENYPETTGKPKYLSDNRTCVLPVKLQPGKFYAIWLNSDKFKNFKDGGNRPAVPYLLTFFTGGTRSGRDGASIERETGKAASDSSTTLLNEDQRAVLAWTDRQFRSFFDARTFESLSAKERAEMEARLIDALKGPQTREYYQAICTLGAMHSAKSLPALRGIAYERADKNNRDRWMAIRSLGMIGDKADVPELIHLVYHGNQNTHWWAQISLVRLTGKNFGGDWEAWGHWWNEQKGEPPYKPEIIRWWNGQADSEKLAESLKESDSKFLDSIKSQASSAKQMEERSQAQTGEQYFQQQLKLAEAGNYWAKFNLWESFSQGKHEAAKNPAEADKWLSELVKGAFLARFEPVNGFAPKTPKEMLDEFNEHCQLRSGRDSLGGASFFRTTKKEGKLIGSFLTASPDEFKTAIEKSPNLKLISMEKVTPEMFLAHEASQQESL